MTQELAQKTCLIYSNKNHIMINSSEKNTQYFLFGTFQFWNQVDGHEFRIFLFCNLRIRQDAWSSFPGVWKNALQLAYNPKRYITTSVSRHLCVCVYQQVVLPDLSPSFQLSVRNFHLQVDLPVLVMSLVLSSEFFSKVSRACRSAAIESWSRHWLLLLLLLLQGNH